MAACAKVKSARYLFKLRKDARDARRWKTVVARGRKAKAEAKEATKRKTQRKLQKKKEDLRKTKRFYARKLFYAREDAQRQRTQKEICVMRKEHFMIMSATRQKDMSAKECGKKI